MPGDAADLAPRLRHADKQEIEALGEDCFSALSESISAPGRAIAMLVDGKVTSLFGCSPMQIGDGVVMGVIWMLASPTIYTCKSVFLRDARKWLRDLTSGCQISGNVVDSRNTASKRWLAKLGYTFGRAIPINDNEFTEFYKHHVQPRSLGSNCNDRNVSDHAESRSK